MEVSNLFVCIMGMTVTFIGLTCLIFLIMLTGKIFRSIGGGESAGRPDPPRSGGGGDSQPAGAHCRYFRGIGGGNGHGCDGYSDLVTEKGFLSGLAYWHI